MVSVASACRARQHQRVWMGPSGPRSLAARGWIIATVVADTVRDGTVWIAEDHDSTDSLLLTGRFSGYLERDGRLKDRFEDLEAEDAIAWGRARAAKVLIRTGDSGCYFSAGERNPDPHEYPEWSPAGPRLERRRPGGFEALDNTESDPPTLWDVRISADLPDQASATLFHDRIRSDPAVRNAEAPAPGLPRRLSRIARGSLHPQPGAGDGQPHPFGCACHPR